jgi:hypothetical protein
VNESPRPPNRPEGKASLKLDDREAELWVEEVQADQPSFDLVARERSLRRAGQVTLSAREAELHVEAARVRIDDRETDLGVVRVESGRTDIALRKSMAYWLLVIFTANTASALILVFLAGLGRIILSEKVIISVLGATVVQAATMLITVASYLFPRQKQP